MKTILILTDFSAKAHSAAEFAMQLALKTEANILLCHALEFVIPLPNDVEFNWLPKNRKLQEKCMKDLEAIGADLQKSIPEGAFSPAIECLTVAGTLAEVTLNVLKDRTINLIVSGAHQYGGLFTFFSKSHSHSIMDEIDCPALFIPEGFRFKSLTTISYATDFSFSNARVLPFLADLAKPFGASIEVNHVSAGDFASVLPKQSVEHSLKKFLKEKHIPIVYQCVKNSNVKSALLEMTRSGETDILAVVHKKYDFLDSLLHQSISKQLAGTASVPLLVLPFSFSQNNADFSNEELDHFCYEAGDLR